MRSVDHGHSDECTTGILGGADSAACVVSWDFSLTQEDRSMTCVETDTLTRLLAHPKRMLKVGTDWNNENSGALCKYAYCCLTITYLL